MKRVRLSRAFGATPKSVYKRVEKSLSMPAAGEHAREGEEGQTALPQHGLVRPWRLWVALLAAALLAITALLLLDPFKGAASVPGEAGLPEAETQKTDAF